MTRRIGIVVFDGAEELDVVGPYEVLAAWASYWPDDDVDVRLVGVGTGPVTFAKGMQVVPHTTLDEVGPLDVVVYPGGKGNRVHIGDPAIGAFLAQLRDQGALVTSVCTGSLVLASFGLLDGRPATTHWQYTDVLAGMGEGIDVRPDARFVDDGDVVTAAGVSAGIDMALHLVARLHSRERAAEVRRAIQYDPQPPV